MTYFINGDLASMREGPGLAMARPLLQIGKKVELGIK